MIPMKITHNERELPDGRWKRQLIVGHNVGFDRSFIREQYHIKVPYFNLRREIEKSKREE